ncbi:hypothetical protein [Xanthomonas phage JGB6]|nr:hypothetical protein [Xanthomonas phage JGB6]
MKRASDTRKTDLGLQDALFVTDLSELEANMVVDMAIGEELVIEGWFYIKRES